MKALCGKHWAKKPLTVDQCSRAVSVKTEPQFWLSVNTRTHWFPPTVKSWRTSFHTITISWVCPWACHSNVIYVSQGLQGGGKKLSYVIYHHVYDDNVLSPSILSIFKNNLINSWLHIFKFSIYMEAETWMLCNYWLINTMTFRSNKVKRWVLGFDQRICTVTNR